MSNSLFLLIKTFSFFKGMCILIPTYMAPIFSQFHLNIDSILFFLLRISPQQLTICLKVVDLVKLKD